MDFSEIFYSEVVEQEGLQKIIATLTNEKHRSLRRVLYGDTVFSQPPYGIDLKPANVILDKEGKLYFIDFFGPMEYDYEKM